MRILTDRLLLAPLAWYLRHSPFDAGRWRVHLAAVRRSKSLRGTLASRTIRTRHGFKMQIDGESQVGRILYSTGTYEEEIAAILEGLLGPGDTFIDGGAHIGFFTVFASRRVGSNGRVIAFEPSAATRAALGRNLAMNQCANVVIRPEGLGRTAGASTLSHLSAGETGHATLRPVETSLRSEPVRVIALDDELATLGPVRVIKLDLEGGELDALIGMRQLLESQRPDVIVEVTDAFLRAGGASADAMYRFMIGLGYRPSVVHATGLEPVDTEHEWRRHVPNQFNAVFTIRSTLER